MVFRFASSVYSDSPRTEPSFGSITSCRRISRMSPKIRLVAAILVLIGTSSWAIGEEPRVKDLPVPEEAVDITYMKRRGDVRFTVDSDFKTTGNYYAKKLNELRWAKA